MTRIPQTFFTMRGPFDCSFQLSAQHAAVAFPETGEASLEVALQRHKGAQPRHDCTRIGRMAPIFDVAVEPHDQSRDERP